MTIEAKIQIVKAIEKMDTASLTRLVDVAGGSDEVMQFFTNVFAVCVKVNPQMTETAVTILMGIEIALQRISRQNEGNEILKSIDKICNQQQ